MKDLGCRYNPALVNALSELSNQSKTYVYLTEWLKRKYTNRYEQQIVQEFLGQFLLDGQKLKAGHWFKRYRLAANVPLRTSDVTARAVGIDTCVRLTDVGATLLESIIFFSVFSVDKNVPV